MVNVTKTYIPNLNKYKDYVEKIFQSGWVTNNGQFVKKLQEELKQYLGVKNILLVCNGTLALQLAYKLLNLKNSTITTPFSFVATVSSQVWEGLTPKFVDIDKETFNIDYNNILKNIDKETSAIVPVHVFGNSCEVEKIDNMAKKHNIKVVYDAAHAFGVKYKGQSILNYGDISAISFHSTKIFHTIEGGALVINDDELFQKAELMINFGIKGPGTIKEIGINAKMNEFEAAMGLCVLQDIDKIISSRKQIFEYYMSKLPNNVTFQKHNESATLNYSYFPILFKDEETLIKVKDNLEKEKIYARRYFYPSLNYLPYVSNQDCAINSIYVAQRILCLPIYYSMELSTAEKIMNIVKVQLIKC